MVTWNGKKLSNIRLSDAALRGFTGSINFYSVDIVAKKRECFYRMGAKSQGCTSIENGQGSIRIFGRHSLEGPRG